MTEVIKWSIFSLFTLLIFVFIYLRRNQLYKDFFLLVFILQVSIYIFIAPNLYSINIDKERVDIYSIIQLICLIFYIVPFILTYYYLQTKFDKKLISPIKKSSLSNIVITNRNFTLFILITFFIILVFIFLFVAFNYNLLFRRIGHEELYEMTSDVPKLLYYPYKLFSELGLFIIILIYLIKINVKNSFIKFYSKFALIIYWVAYGGFVLINNRLQTLILIVTFFGFSLIVKNKKNIISKNTLIIILISFYLIKVVVNIRNNFVDNDGRISFTEVLNPMYQTQLDDNDPLTNRLNGIDLISIYYPKMYEKGFAYFDPWIHNFRILYGSILNTDYYLYSKANLITNARSLIVKKYLDLTIIDYNQCQLTDVFAVLGPFSLFFVAILTAYVFFKVINGFYVEHNYFKLLLYILILPYLLEFEKDFMNFAISWVKYVPLVFLIHKLRIFSKFDDN